MGVDQARDQEVVAVTLNGAGTGVACLRALRRVIGRGRADGCGRGPTDLRYALSLNDDVEWATHANRLGRVIDEHISETDPAHAGPPLELAFAIRNL